MVTESIEILYLLQCRIISNQGRLKYWTNLKAIRRWYTSTAFVRSAWTRARSSRKLPALDRWFWLWWPGTFSGRSLWRSSHWSGVRISTKDRRLQVWRWWVGVTPTEPNYRRHRLKKFDGQTSEIFAELLAEILIGPIPSSFQNFNSVFKKINVALFEQIAMVTF